MNDTIRITTRPPEVSASPIETSKKVQLPHVVDTIQSANTPAPPSEVTILGPPKLEKPKGSNPFEAIEEAYNQFFPSYSNSDPEQEDKISKKPSGAERPLRDTSDLNNFQTDIEKQKSTVHHTTLEKMMVNYYNLQTELEEQFSRTVFEEVQLQHNVQKEVKTAYFNLNDDVEAQRITSARLGWVQGSAAAVLLTTSVYLMVYGTDGSFLKMAKIAAGVTQGTSTVAKGVIDYQNKEKQGELFRLNDERKTLHELIEKRTEILTYTTRQILDIAKMMREILDKKYKAIRMIFS